MYSSVKFYEKVNELQEIHFPLRLEGVKGVNALVENSNISHFTEIKIILLMFTRSQDLYLGVYADLIIYNWENAESLISIIN